MVGYSAGLHRNGNQPLNVVIESEANAGTAHRRPTPASPVSEAYFIPVAAILVQYLNRSAGGLAWSSSVHPAPTFLVLDSNTLTDLAYGCDFLACCFDLFVQQGLGSRNVHDCVVAVPPLQGYFDGEWPLVVSQLHHLLM